MRCMKSFGDARLIYEMGWVVSISVVDGNANLELRLLDLTPGWNLQSDSSLQGKFVESQGNLTIYKLVVHEQALKENRGDEPIPIFARFSISAERQPQTNPKNQEVHEEREHIDALDWSGSPTTVTHP